MFVNTRRFTITLFAALAFGTGLHAAERAKNIILFLADGTGTSTINAASLYGYGKPQALYVQRMPFLGMSETSSASDWVTDSAAGMTAIVTGEKTDNGVVSLVSPTTGGSRAGQQLKTILEYAEEHGLSTGVVSNSPMSDATPAACYGHAANRGNTAEIVSYIVSPKYGDGVDVVIGPGRKGILEATQKEGVDFPTKLKERGFVFLDSLNALETVDPGAKKVVALWDDDQFDVNTAANHAIRILSQNPKGFFLMVESNNHSKDGKQTLERLVAMDKMVQQKAEEFKSDTLVIFTADHSYDLRLWPSKKTKEILPSVRIENKHTGEEVLVGAIGPGAERVHGFFPNTQIFHIMMSAMGWE